MTAEATTVDAVLEIRTYRLKPGTIDTFHDLVRDQSAPLLEQFGVDVLRYGPSERQEDGAEEYVLIRSFESLDRRDEQEEQFYGSPEWHEGPRAAILACIEQYHTIVLSVPRSACTELALAPGD
jgi:hypothetical protein